MMTVAGRLGPIPQATLIEQLLQRIQELEVRPGQGQPQFLQATPSQTTVPEALTALVMRQRSGKQDHPGPTRALVDTPEHIVFVSLSGTCRRGATGQGSPSRNCQSFATDLVVRREITEFAP